eukprot:TRINITY_DN1637_c0_g3_i8.p2 TRINITY_DN1637_c0_g3~~TRINITY_DN1637_c0_g3_i8.p2  ORF type:complete len:189 (+),score=44.01 TRINITY_DN1637_c0_g3_i8:55-621(+)
MIRRPPRSTQSRSSAASDVYKRQSTQSTWGTSLRIILQMEGDQEKEKKFLKALETTEKIDALLIQIRDSFNEGMISIADFRYRHPELEMSVRPHCYNIRPADLILTESEKNSKPFSLQRNTKGEFLLDDDPEEEPQPPKEKTESIEVTSMFALSRDAPLLYKIQRDYTKMLQNIVQLANIIHDIKSSD